jgi:hypothetical protein
MNDLLHRPGMIPAILLAGASVTAILWVALATLTPRAPQPVKIPVIHAYLLPAIVPPAPAAPAPRAHPAPGRIAPMRAHRKLARPSWPGAVAHKNWPWGS